MKEYFGWVLDRAQAKELLSPWSWALPPSLQVDMLSNSEGLCALLFTGILWRFHHWLSHWQLVSTLNLQSLFCPKRLGVWSTWVFHLFSHMVGSSGNQLPSWSSLGAHPGHLIKKYWDTIVNACSEKQWNTSFTCTTQTFLKVLAVLCHTLGKCPNGDTLLCHSSHAESLFFYIVSFVFMQVPALDFS